MEDDNKVLVKIIEAMDAVGYVVKSIAPERMPHGEGFGFTESTILQVRIVPASKA